VYNEKEWGIIPAVIKATIADHITGTTRNETSTMPIGAVSTIPSIPYGPLH
jgi:hypothetical protein